MSFDAGKRIFDVGSIAFTRHAASDRLQTGVLAMNNM